MLDLSKIEAGKMSLDSAEEFAAGARRWTARWPCCTGLGEKFGVTRGRQWLPPDSVRLMAVERMVRQILINLVGNAIKFTPRAARCMIGGAPPPDGGYA